MYELWILDAHSVLITNANTSIVQQLAVPFTTDKSTSKLNQQKYFLVGKLFART